MEFKFNLSKLFKPDEQGFVVLHGPKGNPAQEAERQKFNQKSNLFGASDIAS